LDFQLHSAYEFPTHQSHYHPDNRQLDMEVCHNIHTSQVFEIGKCIRGRDTKNTDNMREKFKPQISVLLTLKQEGSKQLRACPL
jgi:hypothetical protein